MKKIEVSIIIVHYKVRVEIFKCLRSIYESKPTIKFEIVVVDNDEAGEIGSEIIKRFPQVKYVKSDKNLGYGGGNNLGAKYAKGDFLFFLNSDTEVLSNTIGTLFKFISKKINVGAISPLILDKNREASLVQGSQHLTVLRAIFSLSFINKFFPENPIARSFFLKDWNRKSIHEVDVIPGTAFMISKKLFDAIGRFDENLFLFFEESDLAKRLTSRGLKNYIIPESKVIHSGKKSTKQRLDIEMIFNNSKFYYFKKWHGFIPALIVQELTSVNKISLLLVAILILNFFLRIFKLSELMIFIGDQGWFYLSARDMLLSGKIPLVGITSSHTWLHQGPLWTYLLGVIFFIFKFSPFAPAYFTAAIGTFTAFLFYKILKEIYSQKTGLIGALLYTTSPLIIFNDRFAYHTSLIPFFTLIFIYSFYKLFNGRAMFLPLIIFTLSILYNLELFTAVLWIVFILFMGYGLIRRSIWVKTINRKIILISILSFVAPMFPVFLYDINHGFGQTVAFSGWIFYKSIKSIGNSHLASIYQLLNYLWLNYQKLIYPLSTQVSAIILLGSFAYQFYLLRRGHDFNYFTMIMFLGLLIGVVANTTPSDAYLPVFYPLLILIVSVFITWLINIRKITFIILAFILIITSFNSIYVTVNRFFSNDNFGMRSRIQVAEKIIKLTNTEDFNIIGKGEGSQFSSFTMNHEYLLWWKGKPSSKNSTRVKIIIQEPSDGITIEKKIE